MSGTQRYRFLHALVLVAAIAAGIALMPIPAHADESAGADPGAMKAADRNPGEIDVLLAWGKFALESSRFGEAEARFREVLDRDWNNPRAFSLLQETRQLRAEALTQWVRAGRRAEATGDWAEAEIHYQRVIDENPDYRDAAVGFARVRRARDLERYIRAGLDKYIQGDYPGAELDFEQALTLDPDNETVRAYRDQVQDKVTQSSGLADLRSDGPTWTKYLDALKKLRAGDLDGAERLWQEILQVYPGNEAVLSNLEQVTRRRKQEFSSQVMTP